MKKRFWSFAVALAVAGGLTAWALVGDDPSCPVHGVEVDQAVRAGDAIRASVKYKEIPSDGSSAADLGYMCGTGTISITGNVWDKDNHVCSNPAFTNVVSSTLIAATFQAQAYIVDTTTEVSVGTPGTVTMTGGGVLSGSITVEQSWAGHDILIRLIGSADDSPCTLPGNEGRPNRHGGANDSALDMNPFRAKVTILSVDLNGDYNRDGNPADHANEADAVTFDGPKGFVVLANNDDDNSNDLPDAVEDDAVNGTDDLADIGEFKVSRLGIPAADIPSSFTAEFKVVDPTSGALSDAVE